MSNYTLPYKYHSFPIRCYIRINYKNVKSSTNCEEKLKYNPI